MRSDRVFARCDENHRRYLPQVMSPPLSDLSLRGCFADLEFRQATIKIDIEIAPVVILDEGLFPNPRCWPGVFFVVRHNFIQTVAVVLLDSLLTDLVGLPR